MKCPLCGNRCHSARGVINGNTGDHLPIVCRLHNRKWWLLRSRRRLLWFQKDTDAHHCEWDPPSCRLRPPEHVPVPNGRGDAWLIGPCHLILTSVHNRLFFSFWPEMVSWETFIYLYICISLLWKYRPSTHIIIVGLRSCVCSAAVIQLYTYTLFLYSFPSWFMPGY